MTKRRVLLVAIAAVLLIFLVPTIWILIEVNALIDDQPVVDDSIERAYQEAGIEALGADADSSYGAWDEMCRVLGAWQALQQAASAEVVRGEATIYYRVDTLEPDVRAVYDQLIEERIAAEASREPGNPFGPLVEFTRVLSAKDQRPNIDAERDLIERVIELGLFDRLDAAVHAYPFKEPTVDGLAIGRDMSELAAARGLAKAMVADMCLRAEAGDFDTVATRTETLLRLGQAISWNPTIIRWLVGTAIQALTLREIRRELDEYEFTEDAARKMLRAAERWPIAPVGRALDGEQAALDYFMQEYFTNDGNGDGYMAPAAVQSMDMFGASGTEPGFIAAFRARYLMPGRRVHQEAFDAAFDELRPMADVRPIDRVMPISELPAIDGSAPAIVEIMMPAIGKAVQQADLAAFTAAYTRVMLALEVHHAVHGVWPASLDELAPDILDAAPVDPITGQAFGYRVEDDDYVLYGVGIDGVDDGGTFLEGSRSMTPLFDRSWGGHDVELREARDVWEE